MTHLQAFQKELRGKADAALITSHQNQFYLSHFPFEDGYLLIFPDVAYLLTDFRYLEAAEKACAGEFEVLSPETGAFLEIGKRKHRLRSKITSCSGGHVVKDTGLGRSICNSLKGFDKTLLCCLVVVGSNEKHSVRTNLA